jgi:hypothetical protein
MDYFSGVAWLLPAAGMVAFVLIVGGLMLRRSRRR